MTNIEIYEVTKNNKYMFHIVSFDREHKFHVQKNFIDTVIEHYNNYIMKGEDPFYAFHKTAEDLRNYVTSSDQDIDSFYYSRFDIKKVD